MLYLVLTVLHIIVTFHRTVIDTPILHDLRAQLNVKFFRQPETFLPVAPWHSGFIILNIMIILNNVSKKFHTRDKKWFTAIEPTSLTIEQGEIFGLMGYSGAGKSTLLRLINLLERPDSGSVHVNQQDLTAMTESQLRQARQNIGMIFQQFNLLSNRTVAENVAFPLEIAGWDKTKITTRVAECLEIVNLTERAGHYPAQLSGGQKQRVGIARALAPNPSVILADEPTSALDPITTRDVLQCLRKINQKFQVTIVIVTHEMNVIRKLCHRTALLHHGKLIEVATVQNHTILAQSEIGKELLRDD